ncbi:MAG: hypothetical protein QOE91_1166, partial [Gaiellaceae bacterium]|nr:hypothetical protein [Gaiellaceae bacterium]
GLANEQAALRRVATLVAEGSTTEELFTAVANEVAQLLEVEGALLDRYEPDRTVVTLAASHDIDWTAAASVAYSGMEWPLDPGSLAAIVSEPKPTARVDDYSDLEGVVGDIARAVEVGNGCAASISVDGRLWGVIRVFSRAGTLLPADTETRLRGFTELIATAVSNAAAREDLIASRARIVAAGDDARRRIERDLHDGTQQRLIALGLDLQRIRAAVPEDQSVVRSGLDRMEEDLVSTLEDVRELSRGLHPPLLTRRGLRPSLRALARRSPIPVELDVELIERPPAPIETALYYVISEALTNAVKHSQASTISVTVTTDHAGGPFGLSLDGRGRIVNLHATIVDDGVGGADASVGTGLMGLVDRVNALGGRFTLDSPPELGTRISVELPLEPQGRSIRQT